MVSLQLQLLLEVAAIETTALEVIMIAARLNNVRTKSI
jgi:hypothetical protein